MANLELPEELAVRLRILGSTVLSDSETLEPATEQDVVGFLVEFYHYLMTHIAEGHELVFRKDSETRPVRFERGGEDGE